MGEEKVPADKLTYDELEKEVARLTAALKEVVFSCRTKISMKQVANKALFGGSGGMKEIIEVGGQSHEIEVKPITILCHGGMEKIDVPSRVEIGPAQTVAYADALSQGHWDQYRVLSVFVEAFGTVFPDLEIPLSLKGEGMGVRHVVGLILMMLETILAGKQPFLRLPESFLHPKYQCNLADLFIKFGLTG